MPAEPRFELVELRREQRFDELCVMIVTPLGGVRLGGKEARPDFSYAGWFAMLFAAGMGIGLMFFGVAEPITHFDSSFAGDAGTAESWALTSLRERLIKTGARLVQHGRYALFQMAEAAVPRTVFVGILGLINGLRESCDRERAARRRKRYRRRD